MSDTLVKPLSAISELVFKKPRKTASGNTIIDIHEPGTYDSKKSESKEIMYQTEWTEVVYNTESNLCTKSIECLKNLDARVMEYAQESLCMVDADYRRLVYDEVTYFPIGLNTVLFDSERKWHSGQALKNLLVSGTSVRALIQIKKINIKEQFIKVQINVPYIECA